MRWGIANIPGWEMIGPENCTAEVPSSCKKWFVLIFFNFVLKLIYFVSCSMCRCRESVTLAEMWTRHQSSNNGWSLHWTYDHHSGSLLNFKLVRWIGMMTFDISLNFSSPVHYNYDICTNSPFCYISFICFIFIFFIFFISRFLSFLKF